GIKIKKQRTSIKLKMPPNKRQPDFSKSRSLVVFLKRVIIYRLPCYLIKLSPYILILANIGYSKLGSNFIYKR
ncbi:hypothetical protein, partial [Loigolactobacillus zhaoyuanensis]